MSHRRKPPLRQFTSQQSHHHASTVPRHEQASVSTSEVQRDEEVPSDTALAAVASSSAGVPQDSTLNEVLQFVNANIDDVPAFFGLNSDNPLPDRVFAVEPILWCAHLQSVTSASAWRPEITSSCTRCDNRGENWVCLTCYEVGLLASVVISLLTVLRNTLLKPQYRTKAFAFRYFKVCCGRYARGHMLEHFSATRHPIVLSFADLSAWCYICNSYVHNEVRQLLALFKPHRFFLNYNFLLNVDYHLMSAYQSVISLKISP
ncbi:unnamed protein product [Dibothriocephalus latus]|uniref:UBP-type domain-containing protein n=1 Tax=Dibothriocephalus latus TaxID=60516 RepID=A0A3P6TIX5_DIBLA|nr:unnamed protein product [Dibothriocephalus latus]